MIRILRSLFGDKAPTPPAKKFADVPPDAVVVEGAPPFPLGRSLARDQGYPIVDWKGVEAWLAGVDAPRRSEAWAACERGWLLHLGASLGSAYELRESPTAMLLSTLDATVARTTLEYMDRTLARVTRVLRGIAAKADVGKELLVVFDDEDAYYRYVSIYHQDGEMATSGGMFIGRGCGHFVTTKGDLNQIEPVIAHEMTHACVSHLPLPLWLNEGLAVNTETRLCGRRSLYTPQQMHARHLAFWTEVRMQAYWSGAAFYTPGDDSELAYDLARVMAETMSKDWDAFTAFVLDAKDVDAGAASARLHLGADLGDYACALIERAPSPAWSPDPAAWGAAS